MFGNTFTVPHADGDIVCVKRNQDNYSGEYGIQSATQLVLVKIRHTKTKAGIDRHNVELTQTVFATEEAPEISRKAYLVWEQAPGDLDTDLLDALCDWCIASAGANMLSLLQWES